MLRFCKDGKGLGQNHHSGPTKHYQVKEDERTESVEADAAGNADGELSPIVSRSKQYNYTSGSIRGMGSSAPSPAPAPAPAPASASISTADTVTQSSFDSARWACHVCTLVNDKHCDKCAVCNASNPNAQILRKKTRSGGGGGGSRGRDGDVLKMMGMG